VVSIVDRDLSITADRNVCIGAGLCAMTAPAVFDQSADDGRVVLLKMDLDGTELRAAEEAVSLCPSGALSLTRTPRAAD
jgi:ferredoxin